MRSTRQHYKHLSLHDRRRLHVFITMGLSIQEIAQKLGKHRSTLYRELSRNTQSDDYKPTQAHGKMQRRRQRPYTKKLIKDGHLRDYVERSLKKGWSPEQISGRMKYKQLSYYVCAETIYQYVYQQADKPLYRYLPRCKSTRRRRRRRQANRCRYGHIRLINQRPDDISSRKRFGHWEGDLIEFSGTKQKAVTTLVERKSRMLLLLKNENTCSAPVMDKIKEKLIDLPSKMCQTITFDQGSEFAHYMQLEKSLKCKVYYCFPRSPWQKGSNENMNGRLRRYLPRSLDLDTLTQLQLDDLAVKMNRCPRKCIGFKTPQEIFFQQYKNDCRTWS